MGLCGCECCGVWVGGTGVQGSTSGCVCHWRGKQPILETMTLVMDHRPQTAGGGQLNERPNTPSIVRKECFIWEITSVLRRSIKQAIAR